MATPKSEAQKVSRKPDHTKADQQEVAKAPGVVGDLDREPVDPAEASREAVGGPEPLVPTEADNPSPGRNAVPVTVVPEKSEDLIPGTDVPETRAPKAGESTR